MMEDGVVKVCREPCAGCLFGKTPIVSKQRKKQLLTDLRRTGSHFFCHLDKGNQTVCRASFNTMPQMVRIWLRLGATVQEVDLPEWGAP